MQGDGGRKPWDVRAASAVGGFFVEAMQKIESLRTAPRFAAPARPRDPEMANAVPAVADGVRGHRRNLRSQARLSTPSPKAPAPFGIPQISCSILRDAAKGARVSVPEITHLLDRLKSETGESRKRAYDELVTILYGELKRRARKQLAAERAPSFQPTLLVHEAYQRMLSYAMPFEDREHFLNVAATAMRRVLIERAGKLHAAKRGAQCTGKTWNG